MELLPKYKLYNPKPYQADWNSLKKDALNLAIKILKNIELQNNYLEATILQKRKLIALTRTLKNLFVNMNKVKKNNHNFVPLFYIWTMTNNCNFDCTYCSNHRGGTYPDLYNSGYTKDLTTNQGKRLLEIMKESSAIYWCGGEPTIRRDLPELLDYSCKLNMFNMINTNGSLIGDLLVKPRYKKFLKQMDVIIISLDSLNPTQLSEMYRVNEKVSKKVLRNILCLKILQDYVPFKLTANTVITRDTIQESFDILNFCNDLGITFSPVSANLGHEPDWELLNNPRYKKLVKLIIHRAKQGYPMIASPKMLANLLNFNGFNCFPVIFDHIDYDGRIYWPCKAYQDAAMINVLDFKNVKEAHKAGEKIIDPTFFHGNGLGKCNGQCAWMQNCVTDTYASALFEGIFGSKILQEIKGLIN